MFCQIHSTQVHMCLAAFPVTTSQQGRACTKAWAQELHTAFHNLPMQVWSSVMGLDRWRSYFTGHFNLWAPDWCWQLHWKLKKHPQFNMIHANPFILINIPFLCPTLKGPYTKSIIPISAYGANVYLTAHTNDFRGILEFFIICY